MKNTDEFRKALEHKKLPLLVLDQKWHRLFAIHGKTDEIRNAETELNNLLARQGKLNSDLKDYKKVKNQLMDEIVQTFETDPPRWLVIYDNRAFNPPYDARVAAIFETNYEFVDAAGQYQLLRLKEGFPCEPNF